MPAYFFYEAGRKIFSGDSEGIGNNRGKCDFDPKVWLGTSPQEVIRLYVAGRDKTFRCLNKKQEPCKGLLFLSEYRSIISLPQNRRRLLPGLYLRC